MNIKSAIKPTLGTVLIKASIICLKAGTTVTILKILMILKRRATKTLSAPPTGIKLMVTMMKSNTFHPSLKNLISDLSAIIRMTISIVKNIVIA